MTTPPSERSGPAGRSPPRLIRVNDEEDFHFVVGVLHVGRDDSNEIHLPGEHVSRFHARIEARQGEIWVHDRGSANGTFVNGRSVVEPTRLSAGDRISFDQEAFWLEGPNTSGTIIRTIANQNWIPRSWIEDPSVPGTMVLESVPEAAEYDLSELIPPTVWVPTLFVLTPVPGDKPRAYLLQESEGVSKDVWSVGSDESCHVILRDERVSRRHAHIVREGKKWSICDRYSQNLLYVNGKQTRLHFLRDRDELSFGPVRCLFRLPGARRPRSLNLRIPMDRLRAAWRGADKYALPAVVLGAVVLGYLLVSCWMRAGG